MNLNKNTFECFIKLILGEDHGQVVNSTRVELHSEDHVPAWVPETLVVALQLRGVERERERGGERGKWSVESGG